MNHQFLLKILLSPFKSHDLGSASEVLRKQSDPEKRSTILDEIDRDAVTKRLMDILQIKNQENMNVGVTKVHVREIEEYYKCCLRQLHAGLEQKNHHDNRLYRYLSAEPAH